MPKEVEFPKVAELKAKRDAGIAEHRLWKRKINALIALLEAEAAGQRLLPGIRGGTATDS